jgi:heme exporter protein D
VPFRALYTCVLVGYTSCVLELRDSSAGVSVSSRILAAIESLEERVSVLSAVERQPMRSERSSSAQTVGAAPVLTKPGHAGQFKFCEEVRHVASAAMSLFHYNEDQQQWE